MKMLIAICSTLLTLTACGGGGDSANVQFLLPGNGGGGLPSKPPETYNPSDPTVPCLQFSDNLKIGQTVTWTDCSAGIHFSRSTTGAPADEITFEYTGYITTPGMGLQPYGSGGVTGKINGDFIMPEKLDWSYCILRFKDDGNVKEQFCIEGTVDGEK